MSWQLGKAFITFTAKDGPLRSAFGRMKALAGGVLSVFKRVAVSVAAIGAAVIGLSVVLIRALSQQQEAEAKLAAVLKATGNAAGYTKKQLVEMASSLQKVTKFGDEAIITGQALLATFIDIKGTVFKDTLAVALDLSTVVGQDLKSSIVQLGKAINDPVTGMTALRRVGVSFTNAEKDMIVELVRANKLVEAQGKLLGILETQFGGAAIAAADTLGGSVAQLKNELSDLLQKLASGRGFRQLIEHLRTVVEMLSESPELLADFASGLADIGWAAIRVVDWLGEIRKTWDALKENIETRTQNRAIRRMNEAMQEFRDSVDKGGMSYRRLAVLAERAAKAQERATGQRGEWITKQIDSLKTRVALEEKMNAARKARAEEERRDAEYSEKVVARIIDSRRTAEQKAIADVKKNAAEMRKIAEELGKDIVEINEWEQAEIARIRDKATAKYDEQLAQNSEKAKAAAKELADAMAPAAPEWVGLQQQYKRLTGQRKDNTSERIAKAVEEQKRIDAEALRLAKERNETLGAIAAEVGRGGPVGDVIGAKD